MPPGVRVAPAQGVLKPDSALEILVQILSLSYGKMNARVCLELLAPSVPMLAPEEKRVVGRRAIPIRYECPVEPSRPPVRLAPGLGPFPLREVGQVGDGVPFCSTVPKPRAAMQRSDLRGRLRCTCSMPEAKVNSGVCPVCRLCKGRPYEEHQSEKKKTKTMSSNGNELYDKLAEKAQCLLGIATPSKKSVVIVDSRADVTREPASSRDGVSVATTNREESTELQRYHISVLMDAETHPCESYSACTTANIHSITDTCDDTDINFKPASETSFPYSSNTSCLHSLLDEQHKIQQDYFRRVSVTDLSGSGDGAQIHVQCSSDALGTIRHAARRPPMGDSGPTATDAATTCASADHTTGSAGHKETTGVLSRSLEHDASRIAPVLSPPDAENADSHKILRPASKLPKSKSQPLPNENLSSSTSSNSTLSLSSSRSSLQSFWSSRSRLSVPEMRRRKSPRKTKGTKVAKLRTRKCVKSATVSLKEKKIQRPVSCASSLTCSGILALAPVWEPRSSCYVSLVQPAEYKRHLRRPKRKRSKRKTKSAGYLDHSDDDSDEDNELIGTQSEPDSPGAATPMFASTKSLISLDKSGGKTAEASTEEPAAAPGRRNVRCEALRWARGEPLHAHCAFIAFPNDTAQRSLRPWPANRLTRTIFTGAERYVAPQNSKEALSPGQVLARVARADIARKELQQQAAHARAVASAREKPVIPDYEVCDPKLLNFERYRSASPTLDLRTQPSLRKDHGHGSAPVPLMPQQLVNVRLAPPQVEFGNVGLGSRVSTQLVVRNGNDVPVEVIVHSSQTCISVDGGRINVPPNGQAELTVTLNPEDLGHCNGMLRYVLNNSHEFKTPVTAEVVLPSLDLSNRSLYFGFVHDCEEPWPQLVHVVTVQNPLQMASHFEWIAVEKTCYEVVPRCGEVPPRGACACEVRYRVNPDAQGTDAELLLASENDNYLPLSCRLLMPARTKKILVGFVTPYLMLPDLSLLRRRRFVLRIFNASFMDTMYKAVDGSEGVAKSNRKGETGSVAWRLQPVRGILPPRSVHLLILSLWALRPGPLRFELRVALGQGAFAPPTAEPNSRDCSKDSRARKNTKWGTMIVQTITTNVVYPNVVVNPREVCLRRVPAGSMASVSLTFQNMGSVEATVRMVETEEVLAEEWSLSLKADRFEPLDKPLMLPPRSPPVELFLFFRPVDLASFEFLLPLQLNGGLGPPRLNDMASAHQDTYIPVDRDGIPNQAAKLPCVRVDANVSRRLLEFSQTEFNFCYDASDPESNVVKKSLQVENLASAQVVLWIPLATLDNQPFTIREQTRRHASDVLETPGYFKTTMPALNKWLNDVRWNMISQDSWREDMSWTNASMTSLSEVSSDDEELQKRVLICSLERRESFTFDLCFDSLVPGSYSTTLPVFVGGRPNDSPLLHLSLYGIYQQPTLTPCVDEIILSPRPLHVPSEVQVYIEAAHHKKGSTVSWNCEHKFYEGERPPPKDCLQVEMVKREVPHGPATKQLNATVVFRAAWSLGLRARIFFSSGPPPDGASCSVAVTVMADCSLLATHAFLRSQTETFPASSCSPTGTVHPSRRRRVRTSRKRSTVLCGTLYSDEEDLENGDDDWPGLRKVMNTPSMMSIQRSMSDVSTVTSIATSMAMQLVTRAEMALTTATAQAPESALRHGNGDALPPSPCPETETQSPGPSRPVPGTPSALPLRERKRSTNSSRRPSRSDSQFVPGTDSDSESYFLNHNHLQRTSSQPYLRPPRRHRGVSRCSSNVALVNADEDSLVSSENSEDDIALSNCTLHLAKTSINMSKGKRSSIEDAFPYFPDTKNATAYAHYMRRVQLAMQEWLYDVICRREYWCILPDGFNQIYRLGCDQQRSKSKADAKSRSWQEPKCPFGVHTPWIAFRNLAGRAAFECMITRFPEVYEIFKESWEVNRYYDDIPHYSAGNDLWSSGLDEDTGLRDNALSTLRRMALMLQIMRSNGAVLPHVRPDYLIDYCRYQLLFRRANKQRDCHPSSSIRTANAGEELGQKESSKEESENDLEMDTWDINPDNIDFIPGSPLSKRRHRRISRQAWLDVTIQWARLYWLPNLDDEHTSAHEAVRTMYPPSESPEKSPPPRGLRSRQYYLASASECSEHELHLLAWLNERFNNARLTLCPHADEPPPPRFITTFDKDLANGVVLASATLDLCPYLREYLYDLYPAPANIHQAQHNAARLVSAWNAVRLGFTVSVADLVKPLAVKMLLLVAHLYKVLPGISATQTLKLSASLATYASASLTLVNTSTFHMKYLAEFIGDKESFFSVLGGKALRTSCGTADIVKEGRLFALGPEQRVNLQVRFHARTFDKKICTLLLTGLMQASTFGRALALKLEGFAETFGVTETLSVSSPLYRPTKRVLTLPLPYSSLISDKNVAPQFELFVRETKPTFRRAFVGRSWVQMCKRKVLHRLFLDQNSTTPLPLQEDLLKRPQSRGSKISSKRQVLNPYVDVNVTLCAFTSRVRKFWIGCVSPNVGDFIIKVVTRSKSGSSLGTLLLALPEGYRTAICSCSGRFSEEVLDASVRCPLISYVMVPCRNRDLWRAAFTMFEMTLDDTERAFWKEHLDSDIGIQLMQWELEKNDPDLSDEYAHIFNTSVVYRVSLSKKKYLSAPTELSINDVHAEKTVPLAIHVTNDTSPDLVARLRLTSADGREVRNYRLRTTASLEETEPETDNIVTPRSKSCSHYRGSLASSSMPSTAASTHTQTDKTSRSTRGRR